MKVLVINGSPRGDAGNTIHITNAFLRGMSMIRQDEVERVNLVDRNIGFCRGCFHCWNSAEGTCIQHDDMDELRVKFREADLVIWSTPVHTFGMSALMKNFLDRLLPLHLGTMEERDDGGDQHICRYDKGAKKHVLIATCGFYSYTNNVEALEKHFEIMHKGRLETIICCEGALFHIRHPDIIRRANQYLNIARRAGKEYAFSGKISDRSKEQLRKRFYARTEYHILANHHWVVPEIGMSEEVYTRKRLVSVIHCMGALMNRDKFTDGTGVAEYEVPDRDFRAQLHLRADGMKVVTDEAEFLPPHLLIRVDSQRLFDLDQQVRNNRKLPTDNADVGFRGTQSIVDRMLWGMKNGQCPAIRL